MTMKSRTNKAHAILGIVGAVALATALMGTGVAEAGSSITISVEAPSHSHYVSHAHFHGDDCGHYRTWYDGGWVYYYGGRWEYYTPGHKWAYYKSGHVPRPLYGHATKAKSYRYYPAKGVGKPHPKAVRPYKSGSGPVYRPSKSGPSKPHGSIGKGRSGPSHKGMPSKGSGPSKGGGGKGGHK